MDPYGLMVELAACIETTFEDEGRPPVCSNGVMPGDGFTHSWFTECEGNKCGISWVRMVTAYPSQTIGQQDTSPGNCSKSLGIDLEVGTLRCTRVDLPDDTDEEEADWLQDTHDSLADMLALRKAITCCTSLPNSEFILGAWVPMGPLGGFVGGAWAVYVGLT